MFSLLLLGGKKYPLIDPHLILLYSIVTASRYFLN